MTELRRRYRELLRIRNYSPRTIDSYEKIVEDLAVFFNRSPLDMNADDIQVFLYYCVNTRKFAPASINQYIGGLRSFYSLMAPAKKVIMENFRRRRIDHKIPHILERSEVSALIRAIPNIKHRAAIALLYSSGLRASECVALKITDVESGRRMLRVEHGKGGKDRYTILASAAISLLREYYRACRPKYWLFEAERGSGMHLSPDSLQAVLKRAAIEAGIAKRVYPHILRHCFATHLLENGVPINVLQQYLGHRNLQTTATYTHVTENMTRNVVSPLDSMDKEAGHGK